MKGAAKKKRLRTSTKNINKMLKESITEHTLTIFFLHHMLENKIDLKIERGPRTNPIKEI